MNIQDIINYRSEPVPVEIPEWGATVYVKRLNWAERVQLETWHEQDPLPADLNVRSAALFLCDKDGKGSDDLEAVVEVLKTKVYPAVHRIKEAGYEINSLVDLKKK